MVGLKKGLHREAQIASLALLTVLMLQAFVVNRVLGDDAIGLGVDKDPPDYPIGGTVTFSGSGYTPNTEYGIDISTADLLIVGSLTFTTDADAEAGKGIPTGVSWAIPFDAAEGTYSAKVYLASDVDKIELSSCTFTVLSKADSLEALKGNLTDFITDVEDTEISDRLLASLNNAIKKVESAIALFEADGGSKTAANQLRAARNMLTALVHKVLAQTGKALTVEVAGALTEKAFGYIKYIDSLIGVTLEPLGKKLALNVEKALTKQEMHLYQFMIKKGLDEAITDEELLSLLNSMEEELNGALGRAKGKMQLLQDLLDSGVITDDEYQALLMELEKGGDSVNLVKALSELLAQKLEELDQNRPGLGEHLGQLKQAVKQLVDDSTAAGKSHGELMSEAHSHSNQHGGKGGNDNGNGNNNGNGNGTDDQGNGNDDHGNSDHGNDDHGKGNDDNGKGDNGKGDNGKGKGKNN